jgi:hypothetical protein
MKVEKLELTKEDMSYYREVDWYEIRCMFCDEPTGALTTDRLTNAGNADARICGDCYDVYIRK